MRVFQTPDKVTVEMSRVEAVRLGVALRAGYEGLSRPEFYIRTGLSRPRVSELARALIEGRSVSDEHLVEGVEEDENPRRPRGTD